MIKTTKNEDPGTSLCKPEPDSNVIGIPLPSLPLQFHALFEANILQKDYTVYQEEYYDYLGNRGVIISTRHGKSMKTITDFATYSVHQIDLSTEKCVVEDLRQLRSTLFNFTTTATGGHVKGLADIFKFSSKFNETYKGTAQVRGIPAHHWTTCLHVEGLKATFNMDYYFSIKTYDISTQPDIPLRATINGIASNVDQNNIVLDGTHSFNHVYDFISFTPGPIKNQQVFQIPPGIICTGLMEKKEFPKMADQVSFAVEQINIASTEGDPSDPVYMEIDYDFKSKLARLDLSHPPNKDLKKVFGNDSLSLIQDFTTGVQYIIDAIYGNCSVTELTASFSDFTPGPSYLLPPEMRHPIALVEVNYSSMVYQGQKVYRGLPVESWGSSDNMTNFIYEIFILKKEETFHGSLPDEEITEPESIPVGVFTSVVNGNSQSNKVTSYSNIYNYRPSRIFPDRFDIRPCYSTGSLFKELLLTIHTLQPSSFLSDKLWNLNHIHQFISSTAKVMPTRISDLYMSAELVEKTVTVHFILLDKSPMPPGRHSNTDDTPSLQEAYENLHYAMSKGTSLIIGKQVFPVLAITALDYTKEAVQSSNTIEQGYSPGSMAGLGIGMLVTGILCGLAGAYWIHRRKDSSVPYELQ